VYECHVVDDVAERGDDLAEVLATFAVRFEVPDRFQPRPEAILEYLDRLAEVGRLPVSFD